MVMRCRMGSWELEQMLGSEAWIRGLQEQVLEGITKHKRHSLAMMGTGFGRSLLFKLGKEHETRDDSSHHDIGFITE
jgi:superfamily II DNA helicase RecQ